MAVTRSEDARRRRYVHNTDSLDRCRWAWPLSVGTHTNPSEASPSAAMIAPVLRPVSTWTISTCMLCSPSHKQVVSNNHSTRPFSHCIAFAIYPLDVPFFFIAHQTSLDLDSILYIAHPALHPAHPIRPLISLLKPTRLLQSNANPNLRGTYQIFRVSVVSKATTASLDPRG